MELYQILNSTLNLIETTSDKGFVGAKSWINENETLYISNDDISQFYGLVEEIYSYDKNIYTRFTREKIYKHIESVLIKKKREKTLFKQDDTQGLFLNFLEIEPFERYIVAPISGVRLDNQDSIKISIFEIGKASKLKSILSNDEDGYYIMVKIKNIYDNLVAIDEAKNKFLDFIRLTVFISGKSDKKITLKTGLPSYPSMSHEQMYVDTSSYQILESEKDKFPSSTINNTIIEKVPVDNDFFCKNEDFIKIWELYEKKNVSNNISKMETRLLNASIAIGESSMSLNIKNSIIYTSMALEILFSYDEGSLFQKSIGEKLADTFAFMIGHDQKSRIDASKSIKIFYRLRSALVHGGDTKINNDYVAFNLLLRTIIKELLNNEKYQNIKNIEDLYLMVKEAQYSY